LPASQTGGLCWNPGQVIWDLCWTKWNWRRFSPCTSASPAIHSTDSFTLIIIIIIVVIIIIIIIIIHHHPLSRAGRIGQIVANVPSGLCLT
jgi:hypothetical protein